VQPAFDMSHPRCRATTRADRPTRCRTHGGCGAERASSNSSRRRQPDSIRGADSLDRQRPGARRRHRERVSDERVRVARPPDDGAYEDYQQLPGAQAALAGVYLSFFLMLTLMILIGSTWMGLYLAKRTTRPIQLAGDRRQGIGAGHLDHRVCRNAGRIRIADRGVHSMAGVAASRRGSRR